MAVINTNYLALASQNNLQKTQNSLGKAIERLSAGLRDSRARDDVAGTAISQRLAAQVKGLNQSVRNANDAISLAQTADGALGEVNTHLQRMRELAVQAADSTFTNTERQYLQEEMRRRSDEIDRIAETTNFNGQKLLDGSYAGTNFQAGADAGNSITLDGLPNAQAAALGSYTSAKATVALDAESKDKLQSDIANGPVAVTITGTNGNQVTTTIQQDANVTTDGALGQFVNAVNLVSQETGVTAYLSRDRGSIEYRANVSPGQDAAQMAIEATGSNVLAATAAAYTRQGVADLDITTQAGAAEALQRIDAAIESVNTSRGSLGAAQSQYESSISNFSNTVSSGSSVQPRIQDFDEAAEIAKQTIEMMRKRASTPVLAQANQVPQVVLSLLR